MTQDAVVTRTFENGMAEVAVIRGTACGGNCGSCESCMFQNEIRVCAANPVGAHSGQRVVIESRSSAVYKATALVYILPMVLLVLGYALAAIAGAGEGLCVLCAFLGLAAGAGLIVYSQRRKKGTDPIPFSITRIQS